MRKSAQTNNITVTQVTNQEFINEAVRKDNAYKFMASVVGSPAYWENQKKNALAMIRQLGKPDLFITLTAAETKWPELLRTLTKVIDKVDISLEEASEMTFDNKSRLIRSDPITCARVFDQRFKALKKTWMKCTDGPFGEYKIKNMFHRIEFQHRGSPHVHMLVWLENAPKYDPEKVDDKDLVKFIDFIMTTSTDIEKVKDQVGKQHHKCTHTCLKGDRQICRFNAPFRPMDKTRILMPLEKEVKDQMSKEKKKKIRDYNYRLALELNQNAKEIGSFEGLLDRMDSSQEPYEKKLEFYLETIQATIGHPKIFLKRTPKDCRVNGYNIKILETMRSNMDIQFVLDAYACVGYIVDYINKSDRGLSRLLRQCVEDCKKGNKTIKEQMKGLSSIVYNSKEVCAQEAAWCRLRLPMCVTSVKVEFVASGPSNERQKMLLFNTELIKLRELNPESTDIYRKGPIERYAERHEELENTCYADFVACYEYSRRGRKSNEEAEEAELQADVEEIEENDEIAENHEDETGEPPVKKGRKKMKRFPLKSGEGEMVERRQPKVIRYVL